ncbi:MAG TPA: hypothetical protein VM818_00050 [Vicinamibacterales bacterium]|jgi:hypothetical protein|nr:hypothetical protein [Vicinamibacterales bacterium]
MHTKLPIIAFAVVLVSGTLSIAAAQSLADVARKEEERRKEVKQPSKVLTNDDLGSVPPISPPPATLFGAVDDGTAPSESGADKDQKADAEASEKKTDGATEGSTEPATRDQAYWSGRVKALEDQIARNRSFATALQSRINALANEYTNQADPLQQASLATDRQNTLADLDRVNKQLADDTKALADLQEEARRAGVPAGWLR